MIVFNQVRLSSRNGGLIASTLKRTAQQGGQFSWLGIPDRILLVNSLSIPA